MPRTSGKTRAGLWLALALGVGPGGSGCTHLPPISGTFRGDARVAADATVRASADATVRGSLEVKVPTATDPGPMVPVAVRAGRGGSRVALVDVDGLILNQNLTGLYSVGENPVAAFREKLDAAAADPRVCAMVIRINSPGGGVTATDILAEELRRYKQATGRPVVACLMDLATGGGYYLALGADAIVAHPTTITGGIGAILNHYNLQDAMAQLNLVAEPIRSGPLVDLGSVLGPLSDDSRRLLQGMVDGFRDRFRARLVEHRPQINPEDMQRLDDGRVVPAAGALAMRLVDRVGYVHDAIDEAERRASASGSEVVLFQRAGYPGRSLYAITPNTPIQGEVVPFSYPGLDRAKIPTFLYLWQPDPTALKQGGR